jgi:hypothetical protein
MIKLAIFDSKLLAQAYADQIHQWLIRNRPRYNAIRWCDIEISSDEKLLRWYVKVPPDYEVLNASIPVPGDRLTLPVTAVEITEDKLPDKWQVMALIDDDGKILTDDDGKIIIEE